MRKFKSTMLVLYVLLMCCVCTACEQSKFTGNMVCNDNEFMLDYTAFNTTYEHSFDLKKGDIIRCNITTDKGNLDINIQKDEINAYQGNNVLSGEFDVIIEEEGRYTITVKGENAVGCALFEKVAGIGKYMTIADEKAYKEMVWNCTVKSDIIYGQANGINGMEDLGLDIYMTDKEGLNPAIILLHGGGLTAGDKANPSLIKSLAQDYAKMGYVVVLPNYRLGTAPTEDALINAIEDAITAYEWVLTNGADYGIDTNYIAIGGYSAGANIAINMCYSSKVVDLNRENIFCVIDISGGSIYYNVTDQPSPGCVIVHGTGDTTVSYANSEAVAMNLTAKNIDVALNPLEGLNHDILTRYEDVRQVIAEYMYKSLTGEAVTISIKSEYSLEYQKVVDRLKNGISYDVCQLDVKLDGALDEWEGVTEISLNQLKDAGTSLPAEEDFSGSAMMAWNESAPTTLYIAAKIKDDDIKNTVSYDGKWYLDDCLEIVFDTSNGEPAQQLAKWVIGNEGKDLSVLSNNENTLVAMTKNGDEYIYEISIDISKVPSGTYQGDCSLEFSPEKSMGFSICYNDSENEERQHQIGWTSGKSSDRTTLGTLYFR